MVSFSCPPKLHTKLNYNAATKARLCTLLSHVSCDVESGVNSRKSFLTPVSDDLKQDSGEPLHHFLFDPGMSCLSPSLSLKSVSMSCVAGKIKSAAEHALGEKTDVPIAQYMRNTAMLSVPIAQYVLGERTVIMSL